MQFLSRLPAGPLAGSVDFLWALIDAPPHARERILPTGTLELVFNLREDRFRIHDAPDSAATPAIELPGAIVSGARRRSFVVETRDQSCVVGVRFKPGGAAQLLRAPPGEIGDAHLDLRALWGWPASELRERLCSSANAAERLSVLEEELIARVSDPARPHPAVGATLQILARQPHARIRDIAARAGVSPRRLADLFRAEVGMAPKLFARIRRFQAAVAFARRSTGSEWGTVARIAGYFDQSHLIRDVEEFSGYSPVELARLWAFPVKENHVVEPRP